MNIKNFSVVFIFLILLQIRNDVVWAQLSDSDWNLMLIREDKVLPSNTAAYESSLMNLKNFLERENVKNFNYFTHLQDDYNFVHITPVRNLNDIGKGIHELISKETSNQEYERILEYLDQMTESYRYYIIQYKPALSYIPPGDDWEKGIPYRKWTLYHFKTGSEKEVEEILSAWKHMYKDKQIKTGFRVFAGFLGVEQPMYILTTWAADPLDYHEKLQRTIGQLGKEGAVLWTKMMENVTEAEEVEGWFLPQYSYAPGMKLAGK